MPGCASISGGSGSGEDRGTVAGGLPITVRPCPSAACWARASTPAKFSNGVKSRLSREVFIPPYVGSLNITSAATLAKSDTYAVGMSLQPPHHEH